MSPITSGQRPQIPFLRVVCPNCKVGRRLGRHLAEFETIPFPDGVAVLCRDCNVPGRISRHLEERPF
jgi:hypothetical protein